MHEGKTFLYHARSLIPTFYRPEYLAEIEKDVPGAFFLMKNLNSWVVTTYKRKDSDEYGFFYTVYDETKKGEPVTQSVVETDPDKVLQFILIPRMMFAPTRRAVLVYVGDASDEEAEIITLKWNRTKY